MSLRVGEYQWNLVLGGIIRSVKKDQNEKKK